MPAVVREVDLTSRGDPLLALATVGDRLLAMSRPQLAAYMSGLRPEARVRAEYALGAVHAHWRGDPSTMLAHFDERYERHRLSRFLGAAFRRAADGVETRQVHNMPSRYGKSTLLSQAGPGWALDRDPTSTFILSSYAYSLARENADGVRTLLRSRPGELRVRLRADKNRQDRFGTAEGGGVLASGVGGSVIGFGAGGGLIGAGGGVVFDDPFKNWAEAHSEAARKRVWDHYRSVLRLRLDHENAFMLLVMARWHVDDIVGRIKAAAAAGDGDVFTVYRMPAIADQIDDALGREIGEVLVPSRFDRAAVDARARALGSYLARAMEAQDPSPEEGNEIKRDWWQWGDLAPSGAGDAAITSWDMKMKDTTTGDFVVGQAWKRFASTAWCVDQLRGQWNLATTRAAIAVMAVRHPEIRRHVIENTGNGPEVMAALKRGLPRYEMDDGTAGVLGVTREERSAVEALLHRGVSGIVPYTPRGDKTARARAVAPFIEAGDVWLPHSAANGWALQLVNEVSAFPNDEHDDQVDAMSQALAILLGQAPGVIQRPSSKRIATPAPGARIGPQAARRI